MTSPNFINSKNGDVQINGGQLFNADNITYNTPTSSQFIPVSALDILNRHITPGAFLDSNERFDPPRCDLGTRLAIIDRIMDWVTDTNGRSSILWLYGPAGAGKSALGQTIAEKCKDLGILAAVFFFSRNAVSVERLDGNRLIATLVYQLIERFPRIRPYIEKRIGRSSRIFDLGMQAQAENILVYPLNKMSKAFRFLLSRLSTIFHSPYPRLFVVDGLDECRYTHMQLEILEVLARAAKDLKLPFRILVASRPESHIRNFFDHNPAIGHIAVKKLDLAHDRSSDHDIRIYLSRRFNEILDMHPLREYIPSEWPTPEAIEKIASHSSGQFIYAATVTKYIRSPKHQPIDRLKVILGMLEVPRTDKPYAALDALYTLILSSIDDPRIMQIFSVLAIPRIPDDGFGLLNTPAMIDKLLLYQPGDTQLILNDFLSIVTFDTKDAPIKHYHASLNDFLLDRSRSGALPVDLLKTHTQIVRGYLHLIQKPKDYRDWARLEADIGAFLNHYGRATVKSTNLKTNIVLHNLFGDYSSDTDLRLYLSKRFGEITDTHPMRDDIPSEWPPEDAIEQIICRSSGQFLYAAAVMIYIQSPKHGPTERLKIILGILPVPSHDKPYAALDAIYTLVFSSVKDPRVMQIFSVLAIPRTPNDRLGAFNTPSMIDTLLSYRLGDTLRILPDFSAIVAFEKEDSPITHYNASLNNFLLDSLRSGILSVDTQRVHESLARGYLNLVNVQANDKSRYKITYIESDIVAFVKNYGRLTSSSISNELLVGLKNMNFYKIFDKITINNNAEHYRLWESGIMEQLFRQLTCSETVSNSHILNAQMDTFLQATRRDLPEEVWNPLFELLAKPYFQKSMFCIINGCDCTKDENLKACQDISPLATKLSYYVFYSHISWIGVNSKPNLSAIALGIQLENQPIYHHLSLAYICGCILHPRINSDATDKSTGQRGRPTSTAYTAWAFEAHLHNAIFILPFSSFSIQLQVFLDQFKPKMDFWSRPDSPLCRFLPQFQKLQIQINAYQQRRIQLWKRCFKGSQGKIDGS